MRSSCVLIPYARSRLPQAKPASFSIWVSAQCLHAVHFPMPTNDVRRLYLSPFIVIYTPHTGMCFPRTAAKAGMLSGWSVSRLSTPLLSHCSPICCSRAWAVIPKPAKKKGGIKIAHRHTRQWGVPSDIKFTSAATNDSFYVKKPSTLSKGDIVAMDRAYIDYENWSTHAKRSSVCDKMKKNLKIQHYGGLYVPDNRQSYGSAHTTCHIL